MSELEWLKNQYPEDVIEENLTKMREIFSSMGELGAFSIFRIVQLETLEALQRIDDIDTLTGS